MSNESVYLPGKIRDRIQDLMKSRKITQAELDSLYEVYSTRTDTYNVSLGNTAVSAG